ncbi:unnamed protein product [Echinostoma caproni]|uniref:ETF domain-containing protein n=1 Tax=Echinostoma caproni TaxID=27848 RepID=A0A183BGX0_9TREM|nr:unnamed protein product [Echinostoma caproni]
MLRRCLYTTWNILSRSERFLSSLVIVEHSNDKIEAITKSAISAATKFGTVVCVVGGYKCKKAAEEVSKVDGVTKVLLADQENYMVSTPMFCDCILSILAEVRVPLEIIIYYLLIYFVDLILFGGE